MSDEQEATVFLEWTSADGKNMSLVLVQDHDKDIAWFETIRFSRSKNRWVTEEEVESVDDIHAVNYPEEVINELGE